MKEEIKKNEDSDVDLKEEAKKKAWLSSQVYSFYNK